MRSEKPEKKIRINRCGRLIDVFRIHVYHGDIFLLQSKEMEMKVEIAT
jgi:hypothetical protein